VYGGLRFFERAEIKHALAYLRLIENPDDDGAFLRVVNFPARGIGARSIEALQDAARRAGVSLFQAVGALSGAPAAKLSAFTRLIETLGRESRTLTLTESVEHVIERSGLIAHFQAEKEGQERIENLRELVTAAAAFLAEEGIGQDVPASMGVSLGNAPVSGDAAPGDAAAVLDAAAPGAVNITPLASFLSHASLEAGENQAGEGSDAVQLMTVHSAKGLEFDAVFITGLEEGLFPHENSVTEADGLEEERRLMYVAITRARQRLYLSFTQTRMLHGQTRYNLRSRFLEELPQDALKWLTPRVALRSGGGAWREGYGGAWEGQSRGGQGQGRREALGLARDADGGRADAHAQRAAQGFDRGACLARRPERGACPFRRGRHRQSRGAWRGRAGPDQLRARGREVAGAVGREAHRGALTDRPGARANRPRAGWPARVPEPGVGIQGAGA
jgi:DNA helicase-2/ATP-dependent DNA helicase PcrA